MLSPSTILRRLPSALLRRSSPLCLHAALTSSASYSSSPVRNRRDYAVGKSKGVSYLGKYPVYAPVPSPSPLLTSRFTSPGSPLYTVLGIETSCDDTGVSILRSDGVVLGEALSSQNALHEPHGGVVPNLAKGAHVSSLPSMLSLALERAGLKSVADVDAVAVTVGPGLEICLRVGCETAKALAEEHRKPFVAVHHLEAHVLMARLPASPPLPRPVQFPFLSLLVSGGHCQLLLCQDVGNYKVLGGTVDDSLGEAYDKVARMLRLPTGGGGGPHVERLARDGNPANVPLPVPMQKRKDDCDFSFAGLKNSFRMALKKLKIERGIDPDGAEDLPHKDKADLAASFQHAAIKHLNQRVSRAIANLKSSSSSVDTLALVGGVAANKAIRESLEALCRQHKWSFAVPEPRLCTDNGVMIAWAGVEKLNRGMIVEPEEVKSQEVFARFPFHAENELEKPRAETLTQKNIN